MLNKILLFAIILNFLVLIPCEGFCYTGARSQGLCNASTASSRGLESIAWNPANLVIDTGSGFEVILPSLAIDAGNNSFSLNRYNEISGAVLTNADKLEILSDIPDGGLSMDLNANAVLLGLRKGNMALTFQGAGSGYGTIDKDVVDLVLMGNEINQEFRFEDTDAQGHGIAKATFSYAKPLITNKVYRLSAGINTHYLHGIYGFDIASADGSIITEVSGINGSASAEYMTAKGGSGYAVDLGLCLQAPRGWTFGLAVQNVAGSMNWDTDIERHLWSATADSITILSDDISDNVTTTETETVGQAWSENPAGIVRAGCSKMFGQFLCSADVSKYLVKRSGQQNTPELSLGCELGSRFIQPRLGVAVGGPASQRAAAGLGLNVGSAHLDVAVATAGGFANQDSQGLAIASSMIVRF